MVGWTVLEFRPAFLSIGGRLTHTGGGTTSRDGLDRTANHLQFWQEMKSKRPLLACSRLARVRNTPVEKKSHQQIERQIKDQRMRGSLGSQMLVPSVSMAFQGPRALLDSVQGRSSALREIREIQSLLAVKQRTLLTGVAGLGCR